MGNNNAAKDTVCRQTLMKKLPYEDSSSLRFGNGSTVTAARLNFAFNALVDNDKAAELALSSSVSLRSGPKTYDETAIRLGPDGYKAWKNDDDTELSILRKIDRPLQDSVIYVGSVACEEDSSVRFVCRASGSTFVGTQCGLFRSNDGKNFSVFADGSFYAAHSDDYQTFFAAEDGLFQLSSRNITVETPSGTVVSSEYFLNKTGSDQLSACRSVFARNDSRTVYVGTDSEIWYGTIKRQGGTTLERALMLSGNEITEDKTNAFIRICGTKASADPTHDVVAASDHGLYRNKEITGVVGRDIVAEGMSVIGMTTFAGKSYAVVKGKGLYDVNNKDFVCEAAGTTCFVKSSSAMYFGCTDGRIVKYFPFSGRHEEIETKLTDGIQHICVSYPSQNSRTEEIIVGITVSGIMFSVDSSGIVWTGYREFSSVHAIHSDSRNRLFVVLEECSATLSSFDVSEWEYETRADYGQLSSYMLDGQQIVSYIQSYGENRKVDKFVYATQNQIVDLLTGKKAVCAGVTAFKPLHKDSSDRAYAAVESGKLVVFSEKLSKDVVKSVDTDEITDTKSAIVVVKDGIAKYTSKTKLNESFADIPGFYGKSVSNLASDGRLIYGLASDGHVLAASENPSIRTSETLSDTTVIDVRTVSTGNGVNADVVAVVLSSSIEFHQLSGEEQLSDTISSFQVVAYGCRMKDDTTVEAYTSDGIAYFQLSAQTDGIYQISSIGTLEYQDQCVYDRCKTNEDNPIEFVASENSLCAFANRYVEKASGLNIISGYSFAPSAYAVIGENNIEFMFGNARKLGLTCDVSCIGAQYNDQINEATVYFGGQNGLSAVDFSLSTGEYGQICEVSSDVSTLFISPVAELSDGEYVGRNTLFASQSAVYKVGQNNPICEFGDIRSVDGYVKTRDGVQTLSVFVSDGGTLKVASNEQTTSYENLSGINQIAIDEQFVENQNGVSASAMLFALSADGNLYGFNLDTLQQNSNFSNLPVLTRVNAIRKNGHDPRHVIAYADDMKKVYEFIGANPYLVFESNVRIKEIQSDQTYMTDSGVFMNERCGYQVVSARTTQVSCSVSDGKCACIALVQGNGMSASFDTSAALSTIYFTDVHELAGTKSFSDMSGHMAALYNGGRIKLNAFGDELPYELQCDPNRMISADDQIRRLFGITDGALVFASDSGIRYTDSDAPLFVCTEVSGTSNGKFGRIKETCFEVYALSASDVYRLQNAGLSCVRKYQGKTVEDVTLAGSRLYAKVDGVWKGEREGIEFEEAQLSGEDIIGILSGEDSTNRKFGGDGDMLVVTGTGLKYTSRIKAMALKISKADVKSAELSSEIDAVYGTESTYGSVSVNVVCKTTDNKKSYYGYDYENNRIRETPLITFVSGDSVISSFSGIYPVNSDIGSGRVFATLTGESDTYETTGTELSPYCDMRLIGNNVNAVSQIDGRFYICTSKGVFVSSGRGKQLVFGLEYEGGPFTGACRIDENKCLFSSVRGLYTLKDDGHQISASVYKNDAKNIPTCFVRVNALPSGNFFTTADGCSVLTSNDGRRFGKLIELPQPDCSEEDGECPQLSVYDTYALNSREYYFATSNGLYKTEYAYDLVNDVRRFTQADAKTAYESMRDELDDAYAQVSSAHMRAEHEASSVISYVNENVMDTSFSNLTESGWHKQESSSSQTAVWNDIVSEIAFGDQDSGDVYVDTENFLTSQTNVKCSYIFKRYVSGISELYVYVPTTNTYYINHIEGTPGCVMYESKVARQNLRGFRTQEFVSDVSKQYTTFEIGVDSTLLSVDTMLGVQVNGNSLPLKVYSDNAYTGQEGRACMMYHSFIEPSKMLTPIANIVPDENGEYKFKFACFGTDAQAVKLTFHDVLNSSYTGICKVVFHANGASGSMSPQKFAVGKSKKLRECKFTWASGSAKTFGGWTSVPNPVDNSIAEYQNRDLFSVNEDMAGKEFHLYAVWMTYDRNLGTEITLDDTDGELYIASGEILEDENLGNKTVIDYGK